MYTVETIINTLNENNLNADRLNDNDIIVSRPFGDDRELTTSEIIALVGNVKAFRTSSNDKFSTTIRLN